METNKLTILIKNNGKDPLPFTVFNAVMNATAYNQGNHADISITAMIDEKPVRYIDLLYGLMTKPIVINKFRSRPGMVFLISHNRMITKFKPPAQKIKRNSNFIVDFLSEITAKKKIIYPGKEIALTLDIVKTAKIIKHKPNT